MQEAFFNSVFFWFAFVLIFPLITMRLFAEEFKLGTIEPLMTAPVRDWQVVLAKFFGALVFYSSSGSRRCFTSRSFEGHAPARGSFGRRIFGFLSDAVIAGNVLSLHRLPRLGSDQEPDHRGGHFFLRDYTSFSSSGWFSSFCSTSARQRGDLLGYFSAIEHMGTFSRGEIDTRPIVLYLSMTIVMLTLTYQAFQSRKWRL